MPYETLVSESPQTYVTPHVTVLDLTGSLHLLRVHEEKSGDVSLVLEGVELICIRPESDETVAAYAARVDALERLVRRAVERVGQIAVGRW